MIAPSTIAQTAHYTWLCTIYLLPLAFRNTFLMFHLLNSKLVWSPGARADTGVLCFSLDAKVIRLRCFLHIKWSLVKELCCIYSLPGLFLADLGFAPQWCILSSVCTGGAWRTTPAGTKAQLGEG